MSLDWENAPEGATDFAEETRSHYAIWIKKIDSDIFGWVCRHDTRWDILPFFDVGRITHTRPQPEQAGLKFDTEKPLYNLIPVHAEAEMADVLTFGATKYSPNNWRKVGNAKERYIAAAMRHIAAYRMNEESDPESGSHHLAHAMCCLSFIIELDLKDG